MHDKITNTAHQLMNSLCFVKVNIFWFMLLMMVTK